MRINVVWTCVVVAWLRGASSSAGEVFVPLEPEYYDSIADHPDEYADYPHDYFYDQGTYAVFSLNLTNVTFHKCRCHGYQVWTGEVCQNASTYVALYDLVSGEQIVAFTSHLGEVSLSPLTCPDDHRSVLLNSNDDAEFYLLESGNLYWDQQVFTQDLFCIDHILDLEGQPKSWEAQLCLAPPSLPFCCPPGHLILHNGSCMVSSMAPAITPPVTVLDTKVMWTDLSNNSEIVHITCNGSMSEVYHRKIEGDVSLVWHFHGPLLQWTPPSVQGFPEGSHNYCLAVDESGGTVARLCYKDKVLEHRQICNNATCVRKCCPVHHIHHELTCTFVANESVLWQPKFYKSGSLVPTSPPSDLVIIEGMPLCKSFFMMEAHEPFYLLDDGSLHVPNFSFQFQADSYCLDNFVLDDDMHALPLICFEEDICQSVVDLVYSTLLGISCVFLAITLLVYVSVPELHAKVHGKCLVSHVTALMLAYLSLIITQRANGSLHDVACKMIASITHVAFLAAFFWLNVMCFDIWWTLKSMRPVAETGERSRFRFKIYSVYSWGCPTLIAIAAATVQSLPEHYDVIRPDFGANKCWFDTNKSLWAYFYGFVLVLVISNIVFFCWVAYILIIAQNDPILQRTRQQNRERMWLYVKLFLVMGLTWITEVASWQEGSCRGWIFTDIINALQGFFIFLIFICKRNIIKRIRTNWDPYLRRVKELFGKTRPPPSVRPRVRDTSSFSSSVNRPSQSNASQRTVQSQISLDTLSAARKLSTSSLGSAGGPPLQPTSSLSMATIEEGNHNEGEEIDQGDEGDQPDERGLQMKNKNEEREKSDSDRVKNEHDQRVVESDNLSKGHEQGELPGNQLKKEQMQRDINGDHLIKEQGEIECNEPRNKQDQGQRNSDYESTETEQPQEKLDDDEKHGEMDSDQEESEQDQPKNQVHELGETSRETEGVDTHLQDPPTPETLIRSDSFQKPSKNNESVPTGLSSGRVSPSDVEIEVLSDTPETLDLQNSDSDSDGKFMNDTRAQTECPQTLHSGDGPLGLENSDSDSKFMNDSEPPVHTQGVSDLPVPQRERDSDGVRINMNESDDGASGDAPRGTYNRAFTMEHDDEHPVEV